ncbi:MFS transporter [Pseudomonas abietaniphila]
MTSTDITHTLANRRILLLITIFLVATTLRAPITAIGPLLEQIRATFQLESTAAGLLTTIPLLAFAVVSPIAAILARRYSLEGVLTTGVILIAAGIILRSSGPMWGLFVGTWTIGTGVAIGNVLLPSMLKRDFPDKIILVTTLYVLAMTSAAAAASAVAIPLMQLAEVSWADALIFLLILPTTAVVFLLPNSKRRNGPTVHILSAEKPVNVWKSILAWQVTLYLGLIVLVYYIAIAWLPAILAEAGYTPVQAGSLHGVMQLAGAAPGVILIPMLKRMKDQKLIALLSPLVGAVGLLGIVYYPSWASLWLVLFGLGLGAALILALAFSSLRAPSLQEAASLSAMAQCIGYSLAAVGPPLVGRLHDQGLTWNSCVIACAVLCVIMAIVGGYAGRDEQIRS